MMKLTFLLLVVGTSGLRLHERIGRNGQQPRVPATPKTMIGRAMADSNIEGDGLWNDDFDATQEMDLLGMLKNMPEEAAEEIISSMNNQFCGAEHIAFAPIPVGKLIPGAFGEHDEWPCCCEGAAFDDWRDQQPYKIGSSPEINNEGKLPGWCGDFGNYRDMGTDDFTPCDMADNFGNEAKDFLAAVMEQAKMMVINEDEFKHAETAKATGDPHITNLQGAKFDILQVGTFSFLTVREAADQDAETAPLLAIDATVDHTKSSCSTLFIQRVSMTGKWVGENSSAIHMRVVHGVPKEQALEVRFGEDSDDQWQPVTHAKDRLGAMASTSTADSLSFAVHDLHVDIRVKQGKRSSSKGYNFINLYVQGLQALDSSAQVGGLLARDDFSQVAKLSNSCRHEKQQAPKGAKIKMATSSGGNVEEVFLSSASIA